MGCVDRIVISIAIVWGIILSPPSEVHAVPPLPSSVYGSIKVNSNNVLEGTLVEAIINGTIIIQGVSQTYQGESIFSLDIPGDDLGTLVVEGGKEGETILFRVGGVMAKESGIWHSGTNTQLNLTVISSEVLATPQNTPTQFPSQTPVIIFPTLTSTPAPTLAIPQTETTTTQQILITSTPALKKVTEIAAPLPSSTIPRTLTQKNGLFSQESALIIVVTIASIFIVLVIAKLTKRSE